jgi:CPA1 family monovalent cation:H+ antiporter
VWILAERLHLSGIISVVVFGISVARPAAERTPARLRVPTNAVWEVSVFVLNVLAFILVGLQLKPILQRLSPAQLASYTAAAAAVCGAVILVRIFWVMLYEFAARWLRVRFAGRVQKPGRLPSARAALLLAWCGMRGTVTLAAALALPVGGDGRTEFPHRDFILFAAFCVVLVTLVLQGMTLSPLIGQLALDDDGAVENEVRLAREATARAGLDTLLPGEDGDGEASLLRRKYELRLQRFQGDSVEPDVRENGASGLPPLQRALAAERRMLSDLRVRGVIGDDAFHRVEEELDWADLNADARTR